MRCAFFFTGSATTEIYTLSLHDALPIWSGRQMLRERDGPHREGEEPKPMMHGHEKSDLVIVAVDRKSTRLNSSHLGISYAVFCLKEKAKSGGQGEYATAKHVLDSAPG